MDRRKHNGGHSTKAQGPDKRRNEYREAIDQAGTVEDVAKVLRMLFEKATKEKNIKAAQIYLSYYLGLPRQQASIDINQQAEQPIFNIIREVVSSDATTERK